MRTNGELCTEFTNVPHKLSTMGPVVDQTNEVKPSKHNSSDHVNTILPTSVAGSWGWGWGVTWPLRAVSPMGSKINISNEN